MNNAQSYEEYRATLASRGLSVLYFDGYTLHLKYEPEKDSTLKDQPVVSMADLNRFAIEHLNGLFPGVRRVSTNCGMDI